MASRKDRIPALIKKNISEIIQFKVKNPKIGFVTVSEVKVSPDFSHAKIYVSFLNAKYPHQNLAELEKAKGYIRSELASLLDIRKVPELMFIIDDTADIVASLEEKLHR